MSDKRGKYYWVRTEAGKEIAFKRDSGAWEMHGIDCTEDLRELILEVYEEVANGINKKPEKALAIQGVSISLPEPEDCKELIEASKQAYTSIRHETNPSNSQLDAYFRIEKILNKIEGNEC